MTSSGVGTLLPPIWPGSLVAIASALTFYAPRKTYATSRTDMARAAPRA